LYFVHGLVYYLYAYIFIYIYIYIYCLQSETHLIVIERGETINSHVIAGHNIYNFFLLYPSMPRMYIIYYIIYIIIKCMQHYFYKKKNRLYMYTIKLNGAVFFKQFSVYTLADRFFNIRFFFCNKLSIVLCIYVLRGIRASFGPFVRERLLLFSEMCVRATLDHIKI